MIANGKRVGRAELVVETGAEVDARVGIGHGCAEGRYRERGGVHDLRADDVQVVDVALLVIEKDRGFFAQRPADIAAELRRFISRRVLTGRKVLERVASVQPGGGAGQEELAVPLVGARLGQDLDAAVAEFVVFRGKRILIDADLADGRFRRKLAAGESVDVDLAAVGPRRRPGQGLQIGLQFVGIIGKRFEVFALDDDGAGVAGGIYVEGGGGLVGDDDFLSLGLDGEFRVELLGLACGDLYASRSISVKPEAMILRRTCPARVP